MGVNQLNQYIPGQNVQNMGNNVGYNRVSDDNSSITVDFGTTPATVTIKAGTLIEANENLYSPDADVIFQMGSVNDNYILFDDGLIGGASPFGFSSSTSRGAFDTSKQGFYSGGLNTIRTLKWFIDQTAETVGLDTQVNLALTDDMQLTANMRMADFTKFVDTLYLYSGTTDGSGNFSVVTGLNLDDYSIISVMRFSSPTWTTINMEANMDTGTGVLSILTTTAATPVRIVIMKIK